MAMISRIYPVILCILLGVLVLLLFQMNDISVPASMPKQLPRQIDMASGQSSESIDTTRIVQNCRPSQKQLTDNPVVRLDALLRSPELKGMFSNAKIPVEVSSYTILKLRRVVCMNRTNGDMIHFLVKLALDEVEVPDIRMICAALLASEDMAAEKEFVKQIASATPNYDSTRTLYAYIYALDERCLHEPLELADDPDDRLARGESVYDYDMPTVFAVALFDSILRDMLHPYCINTDFSAETGNPDMKLDIPPVEVEVKHSSNSQMIEMLSRASGYFERKLLIRMLSSKALTGPDCQSLFAVYSSTQNQRERLMLASKLIRSPDSESRMYHAKQMLTIARDRQEVIGIVKTFASSAALTRPEWDEYFGMVEQRFGNMGEQWQKFKSGVTIK